MESFQVSKEAPSRARERRGGEEDGKRSKGGALDRGGFQTLVKVFPSHTAVLLLFCLGCQEVRPSLCVWLVWWGQLKSEGKTLPPPVRSHKTVAGQLLFFMEDHVVLF